MGDMKIFSGSVLSSGFVGTSEIQKIYVGNVMVYEKYVAPTGTTVNYAATPSNCSINQTIPYTFDGTTTIEITPLGLSNLSNGEALVFDRFTVGTTNSFGSNDVVNYTFANHVNTYTSGHTSISFSSVGTNVYATFAYNKTTFNVSTVGTYTVAVSRVLTVTTTIDLKEIFGNAIPSGSDLVGRTIAICGYFGMGDTQTSSDVYFEEEEILVRPMTIATAQIEIQRRVYTTTSIAWANNGYELIFRAEQPMSISGRTLTYHAIIDKIIIK